MKIQGAGQATCVERRCFVLAKGSCIVLGNE